MSLHDLHVRYHDRVQFLVVYIREAHPMDGWWLGGGGATELISKVIGFTPGPDLNDPKNIEERREVAGRCLLDLGYDIRTCVDGMDDAVNEAYAALPTRLYLVGRDGRVVYAGGLGPFGFKPAEMKAAIEKYLAQPGATA